MVKKILFLLVVLLSAQLVLAETDISDRGVNPVVIKELTQPALISLEIKNDNSFYDIYTIDTFLDIDFSPKNLGSLSPGETGNYSIEVLPSADLRERESGRFSFEYFVKGNRADLVKDSFVLNIISFENVLDIGLPPAIEAEDEEVVMTLGFNENISLDAAVNIESELISHGFDVTITDEAKEVTVPLEAAGKTAGVYETVFSFIINNETVSVTKDIILGSVVDIVPDEKQSGMFLARTTTLTRTNNGNSVTEVSIIVEKSSLASLFTSFTGAPTTKKEDGKFVYEWTKELNPGESLEVVIKTSYYMPFLVLLLILLAVLVFKIVTNPTVKITKKAIRVRTKSGVFASKMVVNVKNTGKPITNVKVIERLPAFTEILKEKFGVVTPSEIKKRSVIWDFEKLGTGEEIMFSYVIYSKVNVFGKLEVPAAVVTYRDDQEEFREEHSNKIYILTEEEKKEEEY